MIADMGSDIATSLTIIAGILVLIRDYVVPILNLILLIKLIKLIDSKK